MRYFRFIIAAMLMTIFVGCINHSNDQLLLTSNDEATHVGNRSKSEAFITEEVLFTYYGDEVVNFSCKVFDEGKVVEERDLFLNVKLDEINGLNMEVYNNEDCLTSLRILFDSDTLGGGATFLLQDLFDIKDGVIEMHSTGTYQLNEAVQLWSISSGNVRDNRIVIYLYKVES